MIFIDVSYPNGAIKMIPFELVAQRAFNNSGKRLVSNVKKEMRKPKSGRFYTYKGRKVRASAPGEAPAVRSGKLLKSVRYKLKANDMLFGAGNENIDYAKFLERGTRKMKPRGVYEKEVRQDYKNIENDFTSEMNKAIRL